MLCKAVNILVAYIQLLAAGLEWCDKLSNLCVSGTPVSMSEENSVLLYYIILFRITHEPSIVGERTN